MYPNHITAAGIALGEWLDLPLFGALLGSMVVLAIRLRNLAEQNTKLRARLEKLEKGLQDKITTLRSWLAQLETANTEHD